MACSGCQRRRKNVIESFQRGLRVTSEISQRIKRQLNIADGSTVKYDSIKMTAEGVVKICSLCSKQSEPAPSAGQIKPLSCDKCESTGE